MSSHFQNILTIEASTSRASIALYADHVLHEEHVEATTLHAQSLLPMIERLLAQVELKPAMLEGIVFGRGPGSFTGLRIACSIAKGLAYAHDLPLYPVSDLAAIARQVFQDKEVDIPVLAAIDARMNQLYWGYYHDTKGLAVSEYVTSAEEISTPSQEPFVLAGVGLQAYQQFMPAALLAKVVDICEIYPSASALISVAQTTSIEAIEAKDAAPVYIRNQVTHGEAHG